jgi:RNA polymerase sigma-70 factor (ECF subfamily)
MPTWTDADEVLQQTALVIWKKFDQFDASGDERTDFIRWACVIARFEGLAYRRKMARDRLVFSEDLMELMANEYTEEQNLRRHEHAALQACLAQLPEAQSKLLRLAYTPGEKIKEIAAQAGASPASFYMKLNRLRKSLATCVRTRIATEEALA